MSNGSGFTQIPNSYLESILAILHRLDKKEILPLLVVIRKTIGFHQESARVSGSYIEMLTGMDESACRRGLKSLESKGLLSIETAQGLTNKVSLILDSELWFLPNLTQVKSTQVKSTQVESTQVESTQHPGEIHPAPRRNPPDTQVESTPSKETSKETSKQTNKERAKAVFVPSQSGKATAGKATSTAEVIPWAGDLVEGMRINCIDHRFGDDLSPEFVLQEDGQMFIGSTLLAGFLVRRFLGQEVFYFPEDCASKEEEVNS